MEHLHSNNFTYVSITTLRNVFPRTEEQAATQTEKLGRDAKAKAAPQKKIIFRAA